MDELELDEYAGGVLYATIMEFRNKKPNDRSELDRVFAITITELEKIFGYFVTYASFAADSEDDDDGVDDSDS